MVIASYMLDKAREKGENFNDPPPTFNRNGR